VRRFLWIAALALALVAAVGLSSSAEARRGHYLRLKTSKLPSAWHPDPSTRSGTSPTPSASPSLSVSPSSSPTSSRIVSPSASPTLTYQQSEWPNASNTGVPAGTVLTDIKGDYHARTPGEHVTAKRVTGGLIVDADNVVVERSEVWDGIYNGASHPFTVVDTTIGFPNTCGGPHSTMGDNNYTAIRVYARNVSEGPRNSGDNILVQDSFIKLCSNDPMDHSDGFQGYLGGRNVRVIHNTIDQRGVIPAAQTAPVFISDDSKEIILRDNLLISGSMTIRVYAVPGGRYEVTGNRVVNEAWQFRPVDSDCGSIAWSNNLLVTVDANYAVTSTIGPLTCR